ncbi:hypothetical protein [Allobaculum stercoricanis]|uniref:hypothetical protein n=1 Tax=Allobaculum stercoricanis TaxID=174709 RepID=UPI0029429169|nr:hypothetical protein [Allobaculum stercoricanis]
MKKRIMAIAFAGCIGLNSVPIFAMGNSESYCPAVQAAQIEVVNERVFIEEACVDIVDEMKPDVLAVLDKSAKQQERYDTALAKVKGVQLSEDDFIREIATIEEILEEEGNEEIKDQLSNVLQTPDLGYEYDGSVLNRVNGVNYGPSGKETYYNLPMGGVVKIMRSMGNKDPYWVREDGVKMLGDYVMVAAHLPTRPRGSLIMTSLGMGIVCDTGTFALSNHQQLDIAVAW